VTALGMTHRWRSGKKAMSAAGRSAAIAARRNEQANGGLADRAVCAIADGLTVQGFDIRRPAGDRSRFLKITNARGMFCELAMEHEGTVTWECRPFSGGATRPAAIAAMVLTVLGSEPHADCCSASPALFPGLTLKGAAGQTLREHGMQVYLRVLDCDEARCEVYAEIEVTNPARRDRGTVHIDDDGLVLWESHLSHPAGDRLGIGPEEIVRTIAGVLTGREGR
jgi:hypothetical protein